MVAQIVAQKEIDFPNFWCSDLQYITSARGTWMMNNIGYLDKSIETQKWRHYAAPKNNTCSLQYWFWFFRGCYNYISQTLYELIVWVYIQGDPKITIHFYFPLCGKKTLKGNKSLFLTVLDAYLGIADKKFQGNWLMSSWFFEGPQNTFFNKK